MIWVQKGKEKGTVAEILRREGILLTAPCGGQGRCGKCAVRVLGSRAEVQQADRSFFSQEELEQGWRLACRLKAEEGMELFIPESGIAGSDSDASENAGSARTAEASEGTAAGSGSDGSKAGIAVSAAEASEGVTAGTAVAIDLGTTTIVTELIETGSGRCLASDVRLNPQRTYGADVISRIQAAVSGRAGELRELIENSLAQAIAQVTRQGAGTVSAGGEVFIAGNTAMEHLLLGYPCDTLGKAPFTPYHRGFSAFTIAGRKAVFLPGISAFVGADIAAGLLACGFADSEEICFFLDLGTNGEMAVGNRHRILCTSASAGPAFEGGSLSCGVGSIPGAICSVTIDSETKKPAVRTIGDRPAAGVCGTGALEALAQMLRAGIVDETGLLADEYFADGYPLTVQAETRTEAVVITQKDIRELQLAKAAIRAGAETLLNRYGVRAKEVARVYVAGSFGCHLDIGKLGAVGLLPPEFTEKAVAVGNTSLRGVKEYIRMKSAAAQALRADAGQKLNEIIQASRQVSLADDPLFQKQFMNSMSFC